MKGEVLMFGYVVWAMYMGHRVWIWGDLKEDGWQGRGMPFLLVRGIIYSQCRNESGLCRRNIPGE